jgi:hypothetical protein
MKHKYIVRSERDKCYRVQIRYTGFYVNQRFFFRSLGGEEKALEEAIKFRNEHVAKLSEFLKQGGKSLIRIGNEEWVAMENKPRKRPVSQFLLWAGRDINGKRREP